MKTIHHTLTCIALLIAAMTLTCTAARGQQDDTDDEILDEWKMVLINGGGTYGTPGFDSCVVSGSVTYDDNGHITLRNATIRAKEGLYFSFQGSAESMQFVRSATDIYFTLEGENTIEITGQDKESAIFSEYGYMTFDGGNNGNGSLTIRMRNPEAKAIYAPQGASISNCQLTLENGLYANGGIFFDNANVHVTRGGISCGYSYEFRDCVITHPQGERPITMDKKHFDDVIICNPDRSKAEEVRIERRKGTYLNVSKSESHSDWPIDN
ncbi:hypothetical protein BHU11_06910 [Tannerella sp. oral taxon 808]|nr:hypothetical protein BHU11_06910 [Tannerella sp. oral taxon 808]